MITHYQDAEKWTEKNRKAKRLEKGMDSQGGQDWRWELEVKEAMGNDLYRYQVEVGLPGDKRNRAVMFVYLVAKKQMIRLSPSGAEKVAGKTSVRFHPC